MVLKLKGYLLELPVRLPKIALLIHSARFSIATSQMRKFELFTISNWLITPTLKWAKEFFSMPVLDQSLCISMMKQVQFAQIGRAHV